MAKPSKTASNRERLRQEKLAAEKAARQRRAVMIVGGVALAVILVVAGMWAVSSAQRSTPTATGADANRYVALLQHVSIADLDAAGVTGVAAVPKKIEGGTIQLKDGKPRMLYVGAEFCPYCAMSRLSTVVALSRFGTFTGLEPAVSSPNEGPISNIPTVTFLNATYTSDYLVFDHYETSDRLGTTQLQTLSEADQALYDQLKPGGIPWYYWGVAQAGTPINMPQLAGIGGEGLAKILESPSSKDAQTIFGGANLISAQICQLTNQQPAAVCSASGVQAATKLLAP